MIDTSTPEVLARFDAICQVVQGRGRGMSLGEVGDAHALAREMEAEEPDPERVELFRGRLGLEAEEVEP